MSKQIRRELQKMLSLDPFRFTQTAQTDAIRDDQEEVL